MVDVAAYVAALEKRVDEITRMKCPARVVSPARPCEASSSNTEQIAATTPVATPATSSKAVDVKTELGKDDSIKTVAKKDC